MYIDAVDSDEYKIDQLSVPKNESNFNGRNAWVLQEKQLPCSIHFDTRVQDPFSLEGRKNAIKPMMHRFTGGSVGVTHTDSDGSSTEVRVKFEFEPEEPEVASNENNANEEAVEE